jgi:hypothetical protein
LDVSSSDSYTNDVGDVNEASSWWKKDDKLERCKMKKVYESFSQSMSIAGSQSASKAEAYTLIKKRLAKKNY